MRTTRPSDGDRPVSGDDALRRVRDTAVERALTADDEVRRYFALAGVLHRVADETDPSERSTAPSPESGTLAAALTSTVAVTALRSREFDRAAGVDGASAWSPGDVSEELVATGAALACRHADVGVEAVAARAELSAVDLRARVDREK
jgi:hypothetical protein